MAYEGKTDWKYDDVVTERDLNRIEQGVQDSQIKADEAVTKADQAESNSKAYTDQQIQLVTETGIPKLVTYPYVLTATEEGQTDFVIPLETFDQETDTVMVVQNSTVLSPVGFSIKEKTISLVEGVDPGTEIFVQVFKNVPIGSEGAINGAVIAVNSLPNDRVQGFDELFTSVDSGKSALRSAIIGKDGQIDGAHPNSFNELVGGINSIPQAKGNALKSHVLAPYTFSSEAIGIDVVGTMTNNGELNKILTTQNEQFIIPSGYHSGTGKVTASFANLSPLNIREGINIGGVTGQLKEGMKVNSGNLLTSPIYDSQNRIRGVDFSVTLGYRPNHLLFVSQNNTRITLHSTNNWDYEGVFTTTRGSLFSGYVRTFGRYRTSTWDVDTNMTTFFNIIINLTNNGFNGSFVLSNGYFYGGSSSWKYISHE